MPYQLKIAAEVLDAAASAIVGVRGRRFTELTDPERAQARREARAVITVVARRQWPVPSSAVTPDGAPADGWFVPGGGTR